MVGFLLSGKKMGGWADAIASRLTPTRGTHFIVGASLLAKRTSQ